MGNMADGGMHMGNMANSGIHMGNVPEGAQYGSDMPMFGLPRGAMVRSDMQKYSIPGSAIKAERGDKFNFGQPYVDGASGSLFAGPGFEATQMRNMLGEEIGPVPADAYMLPDGAAGNMNIANNLCSKSCCSPQWPTPFRVPEDRFVCQQKRNGNLVPSQYYCNNAFQDAGCLCMTKEQGNFLFSRGGNGVSLL